MLGKICIVCMLVIVSACLIRSQPTGEVKIAGVADDVAALISKLGVKSTDEAVAKFWAKGDDLSKADKEDLAKLLKSSEGAAALAALQRPITSKLAKLDNMLAEYKLNSAPEKYRQAMWEDINKTVVDVNAAANKYRKIVKAITSHHYAPPLQYPARQVLEIHKIPAMVNHIGHHIELVGTADEVVQANLLIRNFTNIKTFITHSFPIHTDNLLAFKKLLAEGHLEDEVFPIYNSLVRNLDGEDYTGIVAESIAKLNKYNDDTPADLLRSLTYTRQMLEPLADGLSKRKVLLDKSGISAARRADIEKASYRLKGAGADGSKKLQTIGIGEWAGHQKFLLEKKISKVRREFVFSKEIIQEELKIEKLLTHIEKTY